MADTSDEVLSFPQILDLWDVLRSSYFRDEPEWESGIYRLLDYLQHLLKIAPKTLDARELRIRLIGNELGAYREALEEAETLVQLAPENSAYQALREEIRQKASPII